MIKDITIIVLALLWAASTYYLGYMTGARREVLRSDARFLLSVHDAMYHSAEQGDVRKLQDNLGMVLLGEVRAYQFEFGDETGTNSFARRYQDAKAIADRVQSTLVPLSSIITNLPHTPDAEVTIGKEKE